MKDDGLGRDDRLISAVRKSLAEFEMTIPEDQIISRGHAARSRRRVCRFAAGALATGALAAAAIAAAVTAPHARQTDIALTAWTVRNQSNGTIEVTIRELRDRAGLQRKLRAEGVRINIRFFGEPDPPCDVYLISVEVPGQPGQKATILDPGAGIIQYGPLGQKSVIMIIRPSAIPAHAGIKVFVAPPASYANANGGTTWAIGTALVTPARSAPAAEPPARQPGIPAGAAYR